jgi:glutamine synthetase
LNTIVAETLDEVATRLEKAKDIDKEAAAIIKDLWNKHCRIVYNGNNYGDAWVKEAAKRGLPNIRSTVAATKAMASVEAAKLFEKYSVLSKTELHSRVEVYWEYYAKVINIEALASIDMAKKQYIPAVVAYTSQLAEAVTNVKSAGVSNAVQKDLLSKVTKLLEEAQDNLEALEKATKKAQGIGDAEERAESYRDDVFTAQAALRKSIDTLETLVPASQWPVPTYAEMLFKL